MPSGSTKNLAKLLGDLKNIVLDRRPILKEIVTKYGNKSLYEYAQDYLSVYLNPPIQKRQDEFIANLKEEVANKFGDDIAESVAKQIATYYYVSTIDHHGPVCHPFFLNANLLISTPYFWNSDPVLKNIIVLSCSNVSLGNSSFPRGLLWNSYTSGKVQPQRLSFLPSNAHSYPVFNFRPYTSDELIKMKKILREKVGKGEVSRPEQEKIDSLLDEVYGKKEILECATYADQIAKTNLELWKRFLSPGYENPPNLIYIEQEVLVEKLLIKHHLYEDTVITHMLFDPIDDELIYKYFENIMGAFSRTDQIGTYLFWALSKDNRIQLWKKGNFLVSEDGEINIELTPESIQKALEEKRIIPSMLLNFTIICFYYGVKCLGGFNQVNYLTAMKNAYIKMQVDRGNYRSIEVCARAQTKEYGGDGVTIAFLRGPNRELVPASGLDLILHGKNDKWQSILDCAKNITLNEALDPLLPELYKLVCPDKERQEELVAISPEEITNLIELDKKIKSCAIIEAS